jgi:hypothetical protein
MQLPYIQSAIRELNQLETQWRAILNPIIANPVTNPRILKDVPISSGANVIYHGLDQLQQGWVITDTNAAVTLYRSAPFNDKTLTLTSSGSATVSIMVF